MKMSDVFDMPISCPVDESWAEDQVIGLVVDSGDEHLLHGLADRAAELAINNHDRLIAVLKEISAMNDCGIEWACLAADMALQEIVQR